MRLPDIGSAALLKAMDRYEGCCDSDGSDIDNPEYRRVLVEATSPKGLITAWCYEYIGPPEQGMPVTDNDWLRAFD